MSAIVTWRVIQSSASANQGRYPIICVLHPTRPRPTSAATTVAPSDFDSEAIWNTVSASTGSGEPTRRPRSLTRTPCARREHRDREAGDAGPLQHVPRTLIETADRLLDLGLGHDVRRCLQRRQRQAGRHVGASDRERGEQPERRR